jgi:hypothetical protein
MTPIGVERRAECHAGSRAVRGPAPSFFLAALVERYGTTVSVTARRRRPLALNRGSERVLSFSPARVRLAGRRRAVSEASAILLWFTFALDSHRFLGGG